MMFKHNNKHLDRLRASNTDHYGLNELNTLVLIMSILKGRSTINPHVLLLIVIILPMCFTSKSSFAMEIISRKEPGEAISSLIQNNPLQTNGTTGETVFPIGGSDNQSILMVDETNSIQSNSSSNNNSNISQVSLISSNATSDTTNSEDENDSDRSFLIISIIANIIVLIVGFCGNTIVILVILKFTRIETVTDIYILNLAVADLMFITGLNFLVTTMSIDHWIFGNLMCKIYMANTSLNQFASSLLLVVMSFDRFLAVCHPIYAQRFRRLRRAKIICLCIWVTCLILMVPIITFAKTNNELTCGIFWPEYKSFNCEIAFTLYSFAIGFAVPLLLIAAFYTCVIRKLRKAATGPLSIGSRRFRSRETTNKRIEHLVIGIIFTYTICWLPYWITQLSLSFTTPRSGFYPFVLLSTNLSYMNSALNPILYAFLSDNFKRRCSDVVRSIYSLKLCQRTKRNETHSTVTTALNPESEASQRLESRQTVVLNESIRLTSSPNTIVTKKDHNYGGDNCQPVITKSTLEPPLDHHHQVNDNNNGLDYLPRKKSVAFSVKTVVVQGQQNETVKSNHEIIQGDTSHCDGV